MAFYNEITQFTTKTKNHASVFNEVHKLLLENTKYNKEQIEKILATSPPTQPDQEQNPGPSTGTSGPVELSKNIFLNSNFIRITERNSPDFWDSTGLLTELDFCSGGKSIKLTAGNYLKSSQQPITCEKWAENPTYISFNLKGNGTVTVRALDDNAPVSIYDFSTKQTNTKVTLQVASDLWFSSLKELEILPVAKRIVLEVVCTDGEVFIDNMYATPTEIDSHISFQYTDGDLCFNDVMQIRTGDLLDAKTGDMWFRSDL